MLTQGTAAAHSIRMHQDVLLSSQAMKITREGTIWPCAIISATMLPSGVPDFMCARSRSPALRCSSPNSSTSLEHCRAVAKPEVAAGYIPSQSVCTCCGSSNHTQVLEP